LVEINMLKLANFTFKKYFPLFLILFFLIICYFKFYYIFLPTCIDIVKEKNPEIVHIDSNYYIFNDYILKENLQHNMFGKYNISYEGVIIKPPGAAIKLFFEKPHSKWAKINIKSFEGNNFLLWLNNNFIDIYSLKKKSNKLIIFIPEKYQKRGINYFYFIINNNEDSSRLMISSIEFSETYPQKNKEFEPIGYYLPIRKETDILWISGLGEISYFVELPSNPYLEYWIYAKSKLPKKSKIKVGIHLKAADASKQVEHFIEASLKKNKLKKIQKLKGFDHKAVKLSLYLQGLDYSILNKVAVGFKFKIRGSVPKRKRIEPNNYNLIYIILDAASAAHFSCYGYSKETTPIIDNFAKKSTLFFNAYSVAVFTRTSTSSLFTSLYPGSHKVFNITQALPEEAETLAEIFQKNGYKTGMFSTTVNISRESGLAQGFRDYTYFPYDVPPSWIIRKGIEWLKNNRNKRFFLYMHLRQPHYPLDAPMSFRAKFVPSDQKKLLYKDNLIHNIYSGRIYANEKLKEYVKSQYDANLNYVDFSLNELLSYIFKNEINKNTMVIISSDHGESLGEHNWMGKSYFGHGSDLHKKSIWIPLIIYYPGQRSAKIIKSLIENIDITPTIIELLGLKTNLETMQGQSFAHCLIYDDCSTKSIAFSQVGNYKAVSAINEKFHIIFEPGKKYWKFYNLEENPDEKENFYFHNDLLDEYFKYQILQYMRKNIVLGRVLTKNWSRKEVVLSPQEIEQLKALGYIK